MPIHHGPELHRAAVDHFECHVQDYRQAYECYPAMAVKQLGNEGSGEAHQCNRNCKSNNKHPEMLTRRTGDSEDVVKRHRDVGNNDLGREKLGGKSSEDNAQYRCRDDAQQNGRQSLFRSETGSSEADNDRIVTRQNQVD